MVTVTRNLTVYQVTDSDLLALSVAGEALMIACGCFGLLFGAAVASGVFVDNLTLFWVFASGSVFMLLVALGIERSRRTIIARITGRSS